MEDNPEKIVLLVAVALIIGIFIYEFNRWLTHGTVEIGGKVVFEGRGTCISVRSAGSATTVHIGFPCKFPAVQYTDKDVKVTIE